MKWLIFLISFSLFAYDLPRGAIGISQIRHVGIVSVTPNVQCKRVDCTKLELEFILYGCLDELGPVFLKEKRIDDRFVVFLNPLNIHMKQSEGVYCILPAKVRRTFELSDGVNLGNLYFSFLDER